MVPASMRWELAQAQGQGVPRGLPLVRVGPQVTSGPPLLALLPALLAQPAPQVLLVLLGPAQEVPGVGVGVGVGTWGRWPGRLSPHLLGATDRKGQGRGSPPEQLVALQQQPFLLRPLLLRLHLHKSQWQQLPLWVRVPPDHAQPPCRRPAPQAAQAVWQWAVQVQAVQVQVVQVQVVQPQVVWQGAVRWHWEGALPR